MAELRGSLHIDLDYPFEYRISHIRYRISKQFFLLFLLVQKK